MRRFTEERRDVRRAGARRTGQTLCRFAMRFHNGFELVHYVLGIAGLREPLQHLVHRVLHAGGGAMKLARRLRNKLAKHVTILYRSYGPINKIRTHCDYLPLLEIPLDHSVKPLWLE